MPKKYKDVKVDDNGYIFGQRTLSGDSPNERWIRFSADRDLLHISEALERYPNELGGYDGPIWSLQDGYGEPGYTPEQGWDWSGIRDSSREAIAAMTTEASRFLSAEELDRILGL